MQYESREPTSQVIAHSRIAKRHPDISEEDVRNAWSAALVIRSRAPRRPEEYASMGFDRKGRPLEMVGVRLEGGEWLVFHAKTPPTKKMLKELGLI